MAHALRTGLIGRGADSGYSVVNELQVRIIRRLRQEGELMRVIGEIFNTSAGNVGNIVARRSWKHVH